MLKHRTWFSACREYRDKHQIEQGPSFDVLEAFRLESIAHRAIAQIALRSSPSSALCLTRQRGVGSSPLSIVSLALTQCFRKPNIIVRFPWKAKLCPVGLFRDNNPQFPTIFNRSEQVDLHLRVVPSGNWS